MDVVSLLPSATEICYALGVEPVGVSHACDHPPAARDVPSMTATTVETTGTSASVDEEVSAAESGEDGVFRLDRAALDEADPDLIVTQETCGVCAVERTDVLEALTELGLDAEVLALDTHGLEDLYEDVERVGAATGTERRAAELRQELRDRVAEVERRARRTDHEPRVAVLDWMDPVMVAGHWIPEMIELAGGSYGLAARGDRSEAREWAAIREYDPEVLVAAPCGFELEQARANVDELRHRPGWTELTAVADGRAHVADGHHYVNRAGPRLVDTLELLAGLVQPGAFEAPPGDVAQQIAGATRMAD